MKKIICTLGLTLAVSSTAIAKIEIPMHLASAGNTQIGTVTAQDTPYGLLLTPHLSQLNQGLHGFHIHEYPSCAHAAKDAGAHFDPSNTGKHLGPYNDKGHLGDLPELTVNSDGTATLPVLAPRLHEKDIKNKALIIHSGDDHAPMGSAAATRMACGIIPS